MTTVDSEEQAEGSGPVPRSAGPESPAPGQEQRPGQGAAAVPDESPADAIVRGVGIGLTLLAVLVLGFAGYLYFLSSTQEARAQTGMYATLQQQMSQAVAPLGSPPPGTPV